ncbi:MAG: AAA family ATPase [Firmicutes bacterium]|nr:AAA family ATPase [Bacillota bacterium]
MRSGMISITPDSIREEIPAARQVILSAELPALFREADKGVYGETVLNIRILENTETGLAVLMETAKQLTNIIISDRQQGFGFSSELSPQDVRFVNMFSLYAASVEIIERCQNLSEQIIKVGNTFKPEEINILVDSGKDELPKAIAGDFRKYVLFYRSHPHPDRKVNSSEKLLNCTIAYFKLMKNTIEAMVRDASFQPYREALENTKIDILDKSFEGFCYYQTGQEDSTGLMPADVSEIIGNEDYVKSALKLARDVAGYDIDAGVNPKRINPILFAMGNPGCGKTLTAHAIGNYFLNFTKEKGIRSRFVIIRRTDWASSYQNASAQNLIDIFKKNILGFKGVVGIYWPDIDTAFSARTESGLRNEEKNILGAVFGLFDGTILPKNGQWFMLCDANYLNMDQATISRITQDPYFVKGPVKPEDFVKLFRDVKLVKHRDFLNLTDEEWQKFGETCSKGNLSGRSMDNISRKAITCIEDFEFPEEYYQADLSRKRDIIKQYSKTLDYGQICDILNNYLEFEKDAEEKAARKKFEDRVDEISTYMSAKNFVVQNLFGSKEPDAFQETPEI